MRILLCNDDGIDATGLADLERAARLVSDDVWIAAPDGNRSGFGHAFTLGQSFTVRRLGERRYACSGTPVDCMLAAMHWIFRTERRPDLVLSGINHGRNVAEDVAYSGTMAVAREATLNGIPAVAFSRPRDSAAMDAPASRWLADCIARLWQGRADWADEAHWLSVNLPRRLPAALAAARIGRDKVGKHVVIHAEAADFAEIEPLSARDYCTSDGDENHLIDAGTASVTRLNWLGHGAVPASILMPGDTRAARQIA